MGYTYTYTPHGVCSKQIRFDIENGRIYDIQFVGGCNGSLYGIGRMCEGMRIEDVVERLDGIPCGKRGTSCPNELCKAIKEAYNEYSE